MLTIITHLESLSPYSPSGYHQTPKKPKEDADSYDLRTWREHAHFTDKNEVFIPGMAFKMCLDQAAQQAEEKVPGKRRGMYGYFLSGVHATTNLNIGVKKDDLAHVAILCNTKGQRNGNGSRVIRRFPVITSWAGELTWMIINPIVTEKTFVRFLEEAGSLVGVGRWRICNGGQNGRFKLVKHKVIEE